MNGKQTQVDVKPVLAGKYPWLLLCLCLLLPLSVKATWYRINVVVFSQVSPDARLAESWQPELFVPTAKAAKILQAPLQSSDGDLKTNPQSYILLDQSQWQLRGISRLLAHQSKHIILDIAWLQTNEAPAEWVHLFGGKAYDQAGNPIQIDANIHAPNALDKAASREIDGLIKISFDRFIDVNARLYLTLPISEVSDVSEAAVGQAYGIVPLQTFSLIQTQRALLKHFLYFDHPLFGMIVYIEPWLVNT